MLYLPSNTQLSPCKNFLFFTMPGDWYYRSFVSITTNHFGSTDFGDEAFEQKQNQNILNFFGLTHLHKLKVRHGSDVKIVNNNDNNPRQKPYDINYHEVDAMIFQREISQRTILGSNTADCPIIFLKDIHSEYYAVIHSGRKSTLENVVGKTINQLKNFVRPEWLQAWIWPGIRGADYPVGEDVAKYFDKKYLTDNYCLSLKDVIRDQLLDSLVDQDNIHIPEHFHSNFEFKKDGLKLYSYRRQQTMNRNFIFILTNDGL